MLSLRSLPLALALAPCLVAVPGCGSDQAQTNNPAVSASPSAGASPSATPSAQPSSTPSAAPTGAAPTAGASATAAPTSAPAAGPARWSYKGDDGPARWGDLSPDYAACKSGKMQSPIDIDTKKAGTDKDLKLVDFAYGGATPLQILNDGHAVQVVNAGKAFMTARGETWKLQRVYLHSPSEHTVDGKATDLEVQLVHGNDAGETTAVAVLFKKGKTDHKALAPIFDNLPADVSQEPKAVEKVTVELGKLIPPRSKYYTYVGSLTAPKCTENVRWYVMEPIGEISDAQLQKLRAVLKTDNNRPVQPVGDRKVMRPS